MQQILYSTALVQDQWSLPFPEIVYWLGDGSSIKYLESNILFVVSIFMRRTYCLVGS